jgi:hypothetical protein
MSSIPASAMAALSVTGPFWTAEIQVIELGDPRTHWGLRSLFLDLEPRSRLGQDQMLLPGTLILLGWARQVTLQPTPNHTYQWQQQVTLPPHLSPAALRQELGRGALALLLVQAEPDAWPQNWPTGRDRLFPPLTCLNGTLVLNRFDRDPAAAQATTQRLYRDLHLPPAAISDRAPDAQLHTQLLSPLSVHSSGLSIYSAMNLPWQSTPIALPLQLAQHWPDSPRFRLTLERDRLTAAEQIALQAAWSDLSQALNPLNPLNPPADDLPPVPNWATLDITNPQAIPNLRWDLIAWGQPHRLILPADELVLLLSDQPPSHQTHPPTALAQIVPQAVAVQLTDADTLEIHVQAGADTPDPAQLRYSAQWQDEAWQETMVLEHLTTAMDPVAVPRALRSHQGLPRPTWAGEGSQPITEPILWGFMPLEDGWAQLPILNLTEQLYLDSRVARTQDAPQPSAVIQGALALGNHQPALRSAHRHEQPWGLTLTDSRALAGTWQLQRPEGSARWHLTALDLTLTQPTVTLTGLLWLSTGKPRPEDALPDWDDWGTGLQSHALKTIDERDRFPSPLLWHIPSLVFHCRTRPGLPASAQLDRWQMTYKVDERDRPWNLADGRPRQSSLLDQLIEIALLPPQPLATLPLIWQRHPALPMVQALPLTQDQSPPNYPSASRQLIPYELPLSANDQPQDWTFTGTQGAAAWLRVQRPIPLAQEWRDRPDLPWVSLSLPGLLLQPDGSTLGHVYRHDLPYTDQIQALAQLPSRPRDLEATSPLPDGDPPTPPVPLTRTTLAAHWQTLSTLASLAQADDVEAIAWSDPSGPVATMVTGLVDPWPWPVTLQPHLEAYPGQLHIHDGLSEAMHLDLAGITGAFQVQDGQLERTDHQGDLAYTVTAGSLAAVAEDGGLRDQRGWTRFVTQRTQTPQTTLLRSPLRHQRADRTVTYELISTSMAVALSLGAHRWQIWLRDLPVETHTQQFRREETRSPSAQALQSDINDPEARSSAYNALNGYEWRLSDGQADHLTLMGLDFYPLTLEYLELESDRIGTVEIIGRLQLPLNPPTGELQDISNAVRLRFTQTSTGLALTAVDLESSEGVWPLALPQGELGTGPMLTWSAIQWVPGDSPRLQLGRMDDQVTAPVWLQFVLFERIWAVPVGVLQLPNPDPLRFTFPSASESTHLALEWVEVNLDVDTGHHSVTAQMEVQIGRRQDTALPPTAFLSTVQIDLLQMLPTWTAAALFFGDLQADATRRMTLQPGTLQFQWTGYAAEDPGRPLQLLPGLHLQDVAQAPGVAALTFKLHPQPQAEPQQTWALQLETAFMELVLNCRWGTSLQDGPTTGRSPLYQSSAGHLSVGYTAHWQPGLQAWQESLLLNGVMDVTNLLSWPLAMELQEDSGASEDIPDQTQLTLPSTHPGDGPSLAHLRHTARILFNQHILSTEMLQPGENELLFDLAHDYLWQFAAVVEHQLVDVTPLTPDLQEHRLGRDRRWTVTQLVTIGSPTQIKSLWQRHRDRHTLDAGVGRRPVAQALGGFLGQDLQDHLWGDDPSQLDQLQPQTLLVDLSNAHWIRQQPLRTGRATALQFLPSGSPLAVPSTRQDYQGTDPQKPRWLLLALPFLGRLQPQAFDDLELRSPQPIHSDPILLLAQDPHGHPLARLLANRGGDAPLTLGVSSFDTATGRTWPRLDALSLEESWFRLQHPQPEPPAQGLQSILASRPETAARLSRATALHQGLDARRRVYPPQTSPEPPAFPQGLQQGSAPPSLMVIPHLDESGLQALYDFQPDSTGTILRVPAGSPAENRSGQGLDLTLATPHTVAWLAGGGLQLLDATLIQSTTAPLGLIAACRATQELTLEVWLELTDAQRIQAGQGPKRIVTLSVNQGVRYLTLGQGHASGTAAARYNLRIRTQADNVNAIPGLMTPEGSAIAGRSHILFTRDRQGGCRLYVNGELQAEASLPGDLFPLGGANDGDYRLALGDELSRGRAWLGTYRRLAIYNRAIAPSDVLRRYQLGLQHQQAPQSPTAWQITGLQLRSSDLWAPDDALTRYAAATQLPAPLTLGEQSNPIPVSLAVSPYLGIEFRPAQGSYQPQLIAVELLCFSADRQDLRPVASHLWEVTPDIVDALDSVIHTWAQQTHLRLAPSSAIALLRYRQINRPTADVPSGAAPLTTTYHFQIVPDLPLPDPFTRPAFPLRSPVAQLRFRQGQFGGMLLPPEALPLDLTPPQVAGVQPLYLRDRPPSPEPGTWPWGLSALRVAVHYTEGQVGQVSSAATPGPWWQAPHYHIQFRSALNSTRPIASLPPYFRAMAVQSLLPLPSQVALPPLADLDTTDWQPILPGGLRYLLTGDRPGVYLTLRHQLIRQDGEQAIRSGSIPIQHRIPRPVPLPPNRTPDTALRPWAHAFHPATGETVSLTPVDNAFFASFIDDNDRPQAAQGLELRLLAPFKGEIDSDWDGAVQLDVQPLSPAPDNWQIVLHLQVGTQIFSYLDPGDGHYTLSPDPDLSLAAALLARSARDRLQIEAWVKPADSTDGFQQVLRFPLRFLDRDRTPLPFEPYFIQFEDPEYNRRLASSAAHASQDVLIPVNGTPQSHVVQLACDRVDYNPDSSLSLRYDWDDGDSGSATLSLAWRRDAITIPLQVRHQDLSNLQAGQLIQISLTDLMLVPDNHADASDRPVLLSPGSALELTLTVRTKEVTIEDAHPVVLTVDIVAEPVTPAPDAAYGLLRQRQPGLVECVRFAWSPVPTRVELVRADDLRTEVVRRRAIFQWMDVTRPVEADHPPTRYHVQKISATGSTHHPTFGDME